MLLIIRNKSSRLKVISNSHVRVLDKNNDSIKLDVRLLCCGPVNHVTLISCFLLFAEILYYWLIK